MESARERILVIKLGALGDFVQALGPMAAIRKYHPQARITLLTTQPYENFARACGYFDNIHIDTRARWHDIGGWLELRRQLNSGRFTRVYDLQNSDRTCFYFRLFKPGEKPEWVGIAAGASHRNRSSERSAGHAFDGHVQTLALAGIKNIEIDSLTWINANISSFSLRKPYVLLVPGSSPQHPGKRWPAQHYGRLANILNQSGFQPVILGTASENEEASIITKECAEALDLTGQTSLEQVAVIARGAAAAIGNDTGPMHLIAATSCPSIVLFSAHSHPVKHAPKGKNVQVYRTENLPDLRTEDVLALFQPREEAPRRTKTMH
jgi:ADP-heptose:LPS heptosyltransferase